MQDLHAYRQKLLMCRAAVDLIADLTLDPRIQKIVRLVRDTCKEDGDRNATPPHPRR